MQSGVNAAEANLGLGSAYLAAGRSKEAVGALREAVRLDPSRPEGHVWLARAYRVNGQLAEAAKELASAAPSAESLTTLYTNVQVDYHLEEGLSAWRRAGSTPPPRPSRRCWRSTGRTRPRGRSSQRSPSGGSSPRGRPPGRTSDAPALAGADARPRRGRPASGGGSFRLKAEGTSATKAEATQATKPDATQTVAPWFADVTAKAGITFVHAAAASPDKRMFETFGSGVAWIDYDNDDFPDLFFVNGAPGSANALYHNNKNGTFNDVTQGSGTAGRDKLQDRRRGWRLRQRRVSRSVRHRAWTEPPAAQPATARSRT